MTQVVKSIFNQINVFDLFLIKFSSPWFQMSWTKSSNNLKLMRWCYPMVCFQVWMFLTQNFGSSTSSLNVINFGSVVLPVWVCSCVTLANWFRSSSASSYTVQCNVSTVWSNVYIVQCNVYMLQCLHRAMFTLSRLCITQSPPNILGHRRAYKRNRVCSL